MLETQDSLGYKITTGAESECDDSGIIWSAIIGGGMTTTVFSLLLFFLAGALGFASLRPWDNATEVNKAFVISGAITLIIVQWLSAGIGGYLTGRMRTSWAGAHTHEVFFRDTVHGFLSWALATLVVGTVLASSASHMQHNGVGYRSANRENTVAAYYVDRLLRTSQADVTVTEEDRTTAERILQDDMAKGGAASDDNGFLAQLVAARTGISAAEAQKRVTEAIGEERDTLKQMNKYVAISSLFIFLSMMIGAFVSSVAGGLGGNHRDLHYRTGKLTD